MPNYKPMFLRVLQADYLKYRKSLVVWIILAYPLFTAALVFIIYFGMKEIPENPVFDFSRALLLVSSFFLPFYLVLLITQINFTENRIQGWKLLYVQPIPKWAYYVSKILILITAYIIAYLLLYVFSIAALKVLNWHHNDFIFRNFYINLKPAFIKILEVYASASLMIAIQYYLSIRLKNFILPLGIGIAATILPIAVFITLGIAGIIRSQEALTKILRFDPYTLPYSFVFDFQSFTNEKFLGNIPTVFIICSAGLAVLVFFLAYLDQSNRNIT